MKDFTLLRSTRYCCRVCWHWVVTSGKKIKAKPGLLVLSLLLYLMAAGPARAQVDIPLTDEKNANFGVEASLYANDNQNTLNIQDPFFIGSDDWFFDEQWPGLGTGVINVSDGDAPAKILAWLNDVNANITDTLRQSIPIYTDVDDRTWIDALYARDQRTNGNLSDNSFFTSGDDKNFHDPETWTIGTGSGGPQKNDIIEFFGHIRRDTPDTPGPVPELGTEYAFLGATTRSQNGTSHLDFELFRNEVIREGAKLKSEGPDCNRTAYRFDLSGTSEFDDSNVDDGSVLIHGDIIFSINYVNGGENVRVELFIWIDRREFPNNTAFTNFNNLGNTPFKFGSASGDFNFEACNEDPNFGYAQVSLIEAKSEGWVTAQINSEEVLGPSWKTYNSKGDLHENLPILSFIELSINATELGLDTGSTGGECEKPLGTVLVKSRSSASFTAELKDMLGPFPFGAIPPVDVTVEDKELNCTITSVELKAELGTAGDFSFQWYYKEKEEDPYSDIPGAIEQIYDATVAGFYKVMVTQTLSNGSPGCTDEDEAVVTGTNEAPPIIMECSPNTSADCNNLDAQYAAWIDKDNFGATDGGGDLVLTYKVNDSDDEISFDDWPLGIPEPTDFCESDEIKVTLIARDDCEQMEQCESIFTILPDNTPPVWDTPENDLDVTLECDDLDGLAAAQLLFPIADDNCDVDVSNIEKTTGDFVPSTECPQAGTYTNTWTVTDDCGNESAVYTQVITIEDTTPPVWDTPENDLDVTLECDDLDGLAAAQLLFPIADDNCDVDVSNIEKTTGDFVPSTECPQAGTYTNTWTVTDDCGNESAVYTQVITIEDTTPPVWETPENDLDVTLECDDLDGLAAAQLLFPIADDNCDLDVSNIEKTTGDFVPSTECPQAGTYTNTWTVTDDCGNESAVYTQVITIEDTTPPVWETPENDLDVTLECDDLDGLAAAQLLFPIADDNCDLDVSNIEKTTGDFVPSTECPQAGTYTNTWTVTDDCGNESAVYTQVITIEDTTPPVWDTPENDLDVTLECDDLDGLAAAQLLFPIADDNCDLDVSNIEKTTGDFVPSTECPQAGTYTNTWTVTDDCGNESAVYTQVITIEDTTPPVWETPENDLDVTLECDDLDGLAAAQLLFPIADDNCDVDVSNIEKTTGDFVPSTECPQAGTYTNTWTVTDDCGNESAVYTQVITIEDTTPPVWDTPENDLDVTLECDDLDGLAAAQLLFPIADDNCDVDVSNIEKTTGDFVPSTECPQAGTYTNTWTVTDDCGNESAVYTQVITIEDTTPPVWDTPENDLDVTLECDDLDGLAAAQLLFPIADDNCDLDVSNIEKTTGDFVPSTECPQAGTYTNTWTVTDDCGNESAVYTQVITIEDTTPPVWDTPENDLDVTLECDDLDGLAAAQLLFPIADDNCDLDVSNIEKTTGDFVPSTECPQAGTYTNTWTVTDDCGNESAVYTQVITIEDTTPPVWDTPENDLDVTLECDDLDGLAAAQLLFPIADDNCDLDVSNIEKTTGDFVPSTECPQAGTYTNTWTVTDDCGNESAVYTQVITIEDTTPPVWDTPENDLDVTLECDDLDGLAAAQLLFPIADDNCDLDVSNIEKTTGDFVPSTECPQAGTYTNTWTVTDDCGNESAVYTQVITIEDTTPPVWDTPENDLDVTLECDDLDGLAAAQLLFPIADDNCDVDVSNIEKTTGDFVPSTECPQAGTYTNTWTVTDDCGNESAVYTQVITIEDTTPPVWDTPENDLDVTLECDDLDGLAAAQLLFPIADDNCDVDVSNIEKTTGDFVPSTECPQAGTYTNTWTVTDDCGNESAVYTQVITIEDTTPPVWETPENDLDVTLECDDLDGLAAAQLLFPIADDNCDLDVSNIEKTTGDFVPSTECPQAGTYTNTWTVTDDCGNESAVYTQVITIEDTTPPVWDTPENDLDVTLECDDLDGLAAAQLLFPIADDNCDVDVSNIEKTTGDFVPSTECPQAGTYTNTWTVTDDCGNESAVYTQVITIEDTTPPVWETPENDLDVTLECDDLDGLAAAQLLFPIADDNCDVDVSNIEKTTGDFVPSTECPQAGTYTNTWTVTDDCGNESAVYTQVITIEDTTPPVWDTPENDLDVTLECDDLDGLAAAQLLFPIADDNCDLDVSNIEKTTGDFVPSTECPQAGTYTNTWTVTDDCGNESAVYTQVITIEDTTDPVIQVPEVDNVCEDEVPESLSASWTDNCADGEENILAFPVLVGEDECSNTYRYTWTVNDGCGNTDTASVEIVQEFDVVGACETIFGYADDDISRCFLEDDFNRWGWTNELTAEGSYELTLYAGAGQCDRSKGAEAGTATIDYFGDEVTVTYQMNGYTLTEAHVYIGCTPYPIKNGSETVAPGQYNFNPELGENVQAYQVGPIDVSDLDDVYVIVHGVACEIVCQCTPDANGEIPSAFDGASATCDESQTASNGNGNGNGKNNKTAESSFSASPVPFNDKLTLKYDFEYTSNKVDIQVYDLSGRLLRTYSDKKVKGGDTKELNIDFALKANQVYIIRMVTDREVLTKNVISSSRK